MIGVEPRMTVLPTRLMPILGLFSADLRELKEMCVQWDQPFLVDSMKFSRRFWSDPTPFDEGLRATIAFYRTARS